jgi:hypothetical protein
MLQALEQQDVTFEVVALYTASEDDTEQILKDHGVEIHYDESPGRPRHKIDGHNWGTLDQFEYMATLRNRLVDICIEKDADYFFSLDSDIILPLNALESLLAFSQSHPGVVSPAVNMTINQTAWNMMRWNGLIGVADRTGRAAIGETGQADVIMAAMLLDRLGMTARWRPNPNGEDMGFCHDCEEKGVPRWWVREIVCDHLMFR